MKKQFLKFTIITLLFFSSLGFFSSITLIPNENDTQNQPKSEPKSSGTVSHLWMFDSPGHTKNLHMSSDGFYISFVENVNKLYVFNRTSNLPMWTFTTTLIRSMVMSRNGEYIAISNQTNHVLLFNLTSPTPMIPIWTFEFPSYTDDLSISDDGMYIAVASNVNLTLFNNTVPTGAKTEMWNFTDNYWSGNVAISGDGNYIAYETDNKSIYLLNRTLPTGAKTAMWSYQSNNGIDFLEISEGGEFLIASDSSRNVSLFNRSITMPKQPQWNYSIGLGNSIQDLAISANGNYAAISHSGDDVNMEFFATSSGVPLWTYNASDLTDDNPNDKHWMKDAEITSNGEYIVAGSYWDTSLYLFDKAQATSKTPFYRNSTMFLNVEVEISQDGRYFASINSTIQDTDTDVYLLYHDISIDENGGTPDGDGDGNGGTPELAPEIIILTVIFSSIFAGALIGIGVYASKNPEKFKNLSGKLRR